MICGGATMLRGSVNFTVLDCFGFCIFFLLQATYLGCHGPEEKTAAKLLILLPTLVLSLYPRFGWVLLVSFIMVLPIQLDPQQILPGVELLPSQSSLRYLNL